MKRKLLSILFVILLLCQFPFCVQAAQENMVAIRSGYWTDDALYTFAHFPQETPEELDVSLFVNNFQEAQGVNPKSFSDTGATAHYLLLVDTSSSMETYAYYVVSFAESLLKARSNLDITIAAMGHEFRVAAAELTDPKEVRSVLSRLSYQHDRSDIGGGTAEALKYLGEKSYGAGDVTNLVVITDGEPWYSSSANIELEREEQATKAAVAMMNTYPEITVHTLCFRDWEAKSFAALSLGKGLHLSAHSASEAGDVGKAFADYLDSLYTVTFPLAGFANTAMITDPVQLFVENSWFTIGKIRNIDMEPVLVNEDTIELPPVDEPEEAETQSTESTEPTEATETTEVTDPVAQATIPDEKTTNPAVTDTEAMDTEPTVISDITEPGEAPISPVMIGTGIAAVVVAALFIVGILAKKKKSKEFSVRVQVEALFGEVVRKKAIYQLTNELLIGTGKQCDIVIRDPAVSEVNTRIFKQGQMIYIEDMGSPQGTILNGMRLFSSNRLRSEDEITIGSTVLRVLF